MMQAGIAEATMTEHRWGRRHPLSVDVAVYDERRRLLVGRSRNVSIGGMFVDTQGVRLAINECLTVAFANDTGGDVILLRVPVLVVHNAAGGTGLMFRRFDSETVHALRNVVQLPLAQTLL